MEKRKPSKGIRISGWLLVAFGIFQLFFVPSALREFAFLPKPALWLVVVYLAAYFLALVLAASRVMKLEKWARGLLVVLLLLGICDKVLFVPLRLKALEGIRSQPQLLSALQGEYRRSLGKEAESMGDQQLTDRIITDLRSAQKALEAVWVAFLLIMLFFYSNKNVRAQFGTDIQREDGEAGAAGTA